MTRQFIKPLRKIRKKNKKGSMELMIFFFIIIAVVLVVGLFIGIGTGVITIFMDEFVPVIESIGTLPGTNANMTQYSEFALTPVDIFVNSLSWMGGVIYLVAFIGLFGLAIGFRVTMSRWLIGIFVLLALMLVIMSIYISNIYEDLYGDSSEFGESIREQKLLAFLILNCPMILTIIIFASGVVMFAGLDDGGGGI